MLSEEKIRRMLENLKETYRSKKRCRYDYKIKRLQLRALRSEIHALSYVLEENVPLEFLKRS